MFQVFGLLAIMVFDPWLTAVEGVSYTKCRKCHQGNIMELLVFICICWGLTNIVSKGRVFEPLRKVIGKFPKLFYFSYLIDCPMCLGFWVGMLMSVVFYSPTQCTLGYNGVLFPVADGFIASGIIWIIYCLLEKCKCYDL